MNALQTFDYTHEGVSLKGQLALPAGAGPHPGVLVMHDARGLGDLPKKRALDLAAAGYAALATDMYGDGAYFADPRNSGDTIAKVMTNAALLRSRVAATFDAFKALPQVDANRIGAIGFCFGGTCVLELVRSGAPARGVVSFHGTLKTATPARAGEAKAKALVLTGGLDPYAPPEDVAAFRAEFDAAGADYHLTIYRQGLHAWTDPRAESAMANVPGIKYDALLDKLSWAQASAFLDAVVKG